MENYTWNVVSSFEGEIAKKITDELLDKKLSLDEYINIILNIEESREE